MKTDLSPQEIVETYERLLPEIKSGLELHHYEKYVLDYVASIARRYAAGKLKPVVHGQWIEKTTPWNMGCVKYLVCSNCGETQCETRGDNGNKFCDSCGALMDESDMGIVQDGKDDNSDAS
jgi:hypothetical protein